MDSNELATKVEEAYQRIKDQIRDTPLEFSPAFSVSGKNKVFLKLENIQHSGSFKVRGALNKLLSLTEEERKKGVITASTGNHGLAIAYALSLLNANGTIYLPEKASPLKLKKLKYYPVKLEISGNDSGVTESIARKEAKEQNLPYVSPYNDPDIIAGQGTIGIELTQKLDHIDHVFITIGGGGLISGISALLKSKIPSVKIHGCQPENSPVMYESVKAGKVIEMESKDTLSDGSAGGMDLDTITFPLVQELVDDFMLVSEEEIRNAIKLVFENHNLVIEGAAGVAVASYLKMKEQFKGNVVIIICGGNISNDVFLDIVTN